MIYNIQTKYYLFLCKITKITPDKISPIPQIILKVRVSPKSKIPKNNAVKGSKAPIIAVFVAPINFIPNVIVSREIIVGKIASPNAHAIVTKLLSDCS